MNEAAHRGRSRPASMNGFGEVAALRSDAGDEEDGVGGEGTELGEDITRVGGADDQPCSCRRVSHCLGDFFGDDLPERAAVAVWSDAPAGPENSAAPVLEVRQRKMQAFSFACEERLRALREPM